MKKYKSFSRKYSWIWFHEKKKLKIVFFYFRMELNFRSPEFTIQSMKLPKVASVAMMYMISIVDSISHCFQIPVPVWVPNLRRFSAAVFWCHLSCMCSSCFVRRKKVENDYHFPLDNLPKGVLSKREWWEIIGFFKGKTWKNQQLIIQVILTKKIETKERDFFVCVVCM